MCRWRLHIGANVDRRNDESEASRAILQLFAQATSDPRNWLASAYHGLESAEGVAEEELGAVLGCDLLVLWAVSRFGTAVTGVPGYLDDLVDESGRPVFAPDWMTDVALCAFAMGAGYAEARIASANRKPLRR